MQIYENVFTLGLVLTDTELLNNFNFSHFLDRKLIPDISRRKYIDIIL